MSKKILVIVHAGGSPHHGPNMRWYYLGRVLSTLGVEVEIVSSSFFHKYISLPDVSHALESQNVDGLTYHWVKTREYKGRGIGQVGNQAEFVAGCYRASRFLIARKPDIVIASSPHPFIIFPAKYIASKSGAELIYEVRDLWPAVLRELGRFSQWHPYLTLLGWTERFAVRKATRIFSVKPGDVDYFVDTYNLNRDKFHYIPNGFLPEISDSVPPDFMLEYRNRYRFLLGYVGAISTYYGLQHLIELARYFKDRSDVGFIIVGKGDAKASLEKLVVKYELHNVHFTGAIEKDKVPCVLEKLDACYVGLEDLDINKYGISCNKIYEYMHAGKPIIGSYNSGYDPVAEAECGMVASPGNYQELCKSIDKLMESPELCQVYGQRARMYFDSHHDFKKVGYQLCNELGLVN